MTDAETLPTRPLVSVVIPAYNAERYIDEAIGGVLAQSYSPIEIIVVDDGSTDATRERLAAYGHRVTYCHQPNSGGYPGSPRNTGIERSGGEYICFLDADDIMLPDRVAKQAGFLTDHPEAGLVFSDYRNFSTAGLSDRSHFQTCLQLQEMLGGRTALHLTSEEATALLLQENFGGAGAMMIRSGVLHAVPGFSTEMQVGEDFHYYYRIARVFGVGIVNDVGLLRRLHDTNITGDLLSMLHSCILSRASLRATEASAINRRLLDEFLFRYEIDLARAYASRRQLKNAIFHNVRALSGAVPGSLDHLRIGLRTLVRTGAIAVHLKRPAP